MNRAHPHLQPFVAGATKGCRCSSRWNRRPTTRPTANEGFSLVEVMCAILILGVGLAGLTHGITTALSSSKESELQTTAAMIAAGQIETLRTEGIILEGEEEGEYEGGLSLYRWKQTVTSTTIHGLYEIAVVVENTKSGKTIYELRTLLFDPPVSSSLEESDNRRDSSSSGRRDRRRR